MKQVGGNEREDGEQEDDAADEQSAGSACTVDGEDMACAETENGTILYLADVTPHDEEDGQGYQAVLDQAWVEVDAHRLFNLSQ